MRAASGEAISNWKKAGIRRMRVGVAIAILAVAACVDDAASDKPSRQEEARSPENLQPLSQPGPKVEIAALRGVPPTEANLFSEMLAEETLRTSLSANGGNTALSFNVTGAMGAGERPDGTYVVAVIDISDETGKHLERVVSDTLLPERGTAGNVWDSVGTDDLKIFAAATARKIAAWYAGTFNASTTMARNEAGPLVTGSIAATEATQEPGETPRFDVAVGPAPGDGATALSRALRTSLDQRMKTATWITGGPWRVEGEVVTASRMDGLTDVTLRWIVKSEDGRPLGEVEQRNALDPARIAGKWEDVAETAGEAAAEGVMGVLQGPSFPVASNS